MPDEELFSLAGQGKLSAQLKEQTLRMLRDSRSINFAKTFIEQWLDISRMDKQVVKEKVFTKELADIMRQEPVHFFRHILKENLSINNFVDSRFAMLNEESAAFYNIEGVSGFEVRPVALDIASHRGGFLSQTALLLAQSSGNDSHPVRRGVWLMKKFLDKHPPEPPPDVPPLDREDPRLLKLSLKEQLDLHRDKAACRDCHMKIDPFGVAFEQYDELGRFRSQGEKYISKTVLPDGTPVEGLKDLKKYILTEKPNDLSRSFIKYLASYALGRSLSFSDSEDIRKLVDESVRNNSRLQYIILALTGSELFRRR
jgi:hypothetical protein